MLLIHCPYCGEVRDEEEFACHGEANIVRPQAPESLDDAEWADYLFYRKNPRGEHQELWYHSAGCRRYFVVTRDTVTYRITQTRKIGKASVAASRNQETQA